LSVEEGDMTRNDAAPWANSFQIEGDPSGHIVLKEKDGNVFVLGSKIIFIGEETGLEDALDAATIDALRWVEPERISRDCNRRRGGVFWPPPLADRPTNATTARREQQDSPPTFRRQGTWGVHHHLTGALRTKRRIGQGLAPGSSEPAS
jgi:hypothetical protein